MDKTKLLLYVVLGVVVFQGVFNLFFSHSLLKDAVSDIKGVKSDLKNISDSLSSSRKQISSIVQNLDDSQTRINLITNRVGVLYLDYKKDDSKFRAKTDSITRRLHDEEKSADSLSRELEQLQ